MIIIIAYVINIRFRLVACEFTLHSNENRVQNRIHATSPTYMHNNHPICLETK